MSFQMPPDPPSRPRAAAAPPRRRPRALVPTLLILGALAVLFSILTGLYTDLLWFRSIGYSDVFTKQLLVRSLIFVVFGLAMAAAVAVNFVVAHRTRPIYQPFSPEQQNLERYRSSVEPFRWLIVVATSAMLGLLAGSAAAGQWRTFLLWRNGEAFPVTDPQFDVNVAFYIFSLPWWRFLVGFGFAVVVLSLIAAAATHYLYGGLRLQTAGDRTSSAARAHLSVLLGLFVLLKAVSYWLDRYSLLTDEGRVGEGAFTGLTYTDVNAVLPAKSILAAISVVCAVLFFVNVVRRTWLLPGVGVGLLLLSAILVGGVYPAIVQRFQVVPDEPNREAPFIERNITATREAYGIDDTEVQEYTPETTASPGQLRDDAETAASIRLLDPALLTPTYRNLQQIRQYYDFPATLDVDRYEIDGETRDTVVAVRELDISQVEGTQRNWANDRLTYTHGFGFVAALGDTREPDGAPSFVSANIPPEGVLGERDFQPRIYYGETSPTYSIVGATANGEPLELDFPDDDSPGGQRNFTYDGEGGVPVDSLWRRLLFAGKYQEPNILLSDRLTDASKILYERDPQTRVEKIAPWLTLDGDPYPAVVGDEILWIIDGYTTSNNYPYSDRTELDAATTTSLSEQQQQLVAPVERVNYMRNSVKATVDAYDGTVNLYAWDENDPVLKTWMNAFPGTVQPRSEISEDLENHLRYPQDLFKVQREKLTRYHVTNPLTFYNEGDFWRIPSDPTRETEEEQPPYYLTLQMPGQEEASFSLTSTFVPAGNRPNLVAFAAVNADPGEDYGTIRVLQLPRSAQLNGPQQVQNQFNSNSEVAETVNVLELGNSRVEFGNLLTLPVGGGLLYVQPVFVRAEAESGFPLLRKVLVSFGDRVSFEDTLQEALDDLFGGAAGVETEEPAPEEILEELDEGTDPVAPQLPGDGTEDGVVDEVPTPETPVVPPADGTPGDGAPAGDLDQALADIEAAFAEGQAALRENDFGAYGEAQERLRDAIERAVAAEAAAAGGVGGAGDAAEGGGEAGEAAATE